MPRSTALLAELRAAGLPAVISGAGPTVLALDDRWRPRERAIGFARRGWTAHAARRRPIGGAQVVAL